MMPVLCSDIYETVIWWRFVCVIHSSMATKNLFSIKPFDEKIYKDKIHYVQIVSIPLVWLHTTRALPLREAVIYFPHVIK